MYSVGGMAEWFKATVLKTVIRLRGSWVRILLPPPIRKKVLARPLRGLAVNFSGKAEFFVFVLRSKKPETVFSLIVFFICYHIVGIEL
jgi:hypothetical protein